MVKKILVLGVPDRWHNNEILSGVLMGYFAAKKMGQLKFVGVTENFPPPVTSTLETFPWNTLNEYDVIVSMGQNKDFGPKGPSEILESPNNMTKEQANAITDFVKAGKGLVAIHGAGVDFNDEYTKMIGGRFITHPPIHEFAIDIDDVEHPITQGLKPFSVVDELYITDYDKNTVHILLSTQWQGTIKWGVDREFSERNRTYYESAKRKVPMVWIKPYGDGRVAYIAPGHDFRTLLHPTFLQLVEQATLWASHRL